MTEFAESDPWTLEEHMEQGANAVAAISRSFDSRDPLPICHHFWAESNDDDQFQNTVSGERFGYLVPIFQAMGLAFEADRLETWETVAPSNDWLDRRVPTLFALARRSGFSGYHGWTCEPHDAQPIGACEFQVVNHRANAKDH